MVKFKNIHYAWFVLLAVSMIRGFASPALSASTGLFLTPISDRFKPETGNLSLYFSLSSIISLFWLPLCGNLFYQYKARSIALLGSCLQAFAFIGLGFLTSRWGFYFLALPLTMGSILLVYLLGPILINRWFSKNQGYMLGIMMAVTNVFSILFQPFLTNWIAVYTWRFTYIIFGFFSFLFFIILTLVFLKNKPEDHHISPYGNLEGLKKEDRFFDMKKIGIPSSSALGSLSFIFLLILVIAWTGFSIFSQHLPAYAQELGYSLDNLEWILSVSVLISILALLFIGLCCDRFGVLATSLGLLILGFLSILLFSFFGNNFTLFTLGILSHKIVSSALLLIIPLLISFFFGSKDYEKLISCIMIGIPFSSMIFTPLYQFLYNIFRSYQFVLFFILALLLLGMLSLLMGSKQACMVNSD